MKCPDCGAGVEIEQNHLTEEEYTMVMSCLECAFKVETESNLVARDRRAR